MQLLTLTEHLFAEEGKKVFAVLDGASIPDLRETLFEHQKESVCLHGGDLEPDMETVAAYLVELELDEKFTNWVLEKGWGNHWGIFALSEEDLRTMRGHFRSLVIVYDEEGTPMYFRFYDPRVLRKFLPTCKPQELRQLFGPVASFFVESEEGRAALRFRAPAGSLKTERVDLSSEVAG
jgi:hypothetical protein